MRYPSSREQELLEQIYRAAKGGGAEAVERLYPAIGPEAPSKLSAVDHLLRNAQGAYKSSGLSDLKRTVGQNDFVVQAGDETLRGIQTLADKIPLGKGGATATRMAGSGAMKTIAKALPLAGAVMLPLDAADVVVGGDSVANKVMDGSAMAIGGVLGAAAGPLGAAAGASGGKAVSDAIQWLAGGMGRDTSAEDAKLKRFIDAYNRGEI